MNSITSCVEKLAGDESWQGNTTDPERAELLKWGEGRMSSALAMEYAHVFGILRLCNATLANPTIDRRNFIEAMTRS